MSRQKDEPDLTSQRKHSVLTEQLQRDIVVLSNSARDGGEVRASIASYIAAINALPASAVIRASQEIRTTGELYRIWEPPSGRLSSFSDWLEFLSGKPRNSILDRQLAVLSDNPLLGYLFIFHGDGRIREAALKCLDEPPTSSFAFASLAYSLNDWVEQVREAALHAVEQLFPRTSAAIIAEAAFFLLPQTQHLKRWGDRERQCLDTALYRPDVLQTLADRLMQRPTGRVSKVLRQALRHPGLDDALPRLARDAALPHIRAIALETLIRRRASWNIGHSYEWIDKRYNLRKRVPQFDQRPIEHGFDIETLLADGAVDHASAVRKVVAQALIDLGQTLSPAMKRIGHTLSEDESAAVRSRATFFVKGSSSQNTDDPMS